MINGTQNAFPPGAPADLCALTSSKWNFYDLSPASWKGWLTFNVLSVQRIAAPQEDFIESESRKQDNLRQVSVN